MPQETLPDHGYLYQQIVEQNSLAIIYGGRNGLIQLWNKGAEAIFGWTAAEAIGQSMDIIIPEKHREKHWTGYDTVMQTGESKYASNVLSVPALTKSGARISVEFTVVLVKNDSGEVLGIAATLQDVSERWKHEKELRAKLAALEAQIAGK